MDKRAPKCPCCLDGKWLGTCPLCKSELINDELAAAYRLIAGLEGDMDIDAAKAARAVLGLDVVDGECTGNSFALEEFQSLLQARTTQLADREGIEPPTSRVISSRILPLNYRSE